MTLVLLTGISGFIAKHCAVKLLNAGYTLRGSLRRLDRADEVRSALRPALTTPAALERLSFVALDLEADTGWDQAMAGVDALMHTASPFPIAAPKVPDDLIRPAVEGTRRAIGAAKAAGIRRVVLTSSSAAIIHDGKAGALDEGDWCDVDAPQTSAYSRSKTLAERAAWEMVTDGDTALTVINPGFVLGPPLDAHYGSSVSVVRRLLKGRDPMLPSLGFPVVDVRDVAEMHLRALQRPETAGKRYIAAAGSMLMVEMGRVLQAAYPVLRIPTRQAPDFLIRIIALWDKDVRAILPSLGHMPQMSNLRAVTDMGMVFIAPDAALRAAAEVLVKSGEIRV